MVPAPPRVLPRSLAPSGALWGGAVRSRFPPTWLGVLGVAVGRPRGGCLLLLRGASGVRRSPSPDCPPTGRAVGVRYPRVVGAGVRVWGPFSVPSACTPCGGCAPRGGSVAFVCRGAGWGGGCAPYPPFVRPGGACTAGGRSASFRPSAFPGQATKRVSLASRCPWGAWPPVPLRFVLARLLWAPSVRRPGASARARLFSAAPVGADGWGGGADRAQAPVSGGGGHHPPCLGGWGPGPPRLAGRWGGWGGGSGCSLPAPLLGGSLRYSILALLVSSAHSLPACACGRGRGAATGWGGGEGPPVDRSPGGPCRPEPPLLPSLSGLWSREGHLGRGLHTFLVRRRAPPPGLVRASLRHAGVGSPCGRDPGGSRRPGGPGARGVQVQPHPPPPCRGPFWGGGGVPSAPGERRAAPVAPKLGGGAGGGWGGRPPATPPRRALACHLLSPPCPPGVYSCRGGCRAAAGVRRGPVGRRRASAAGGGGGEGWGTPPPWFAPPSSLDRPLIGSFRLRRPGRAGACLGRGTPAPRVQRPLRGGCGAAVSSVCLRPLLGSVKSTPPSYVVY